MNNEGLQRPEITYPCSWEYRIIGISDHLVRQAIVDLIGEVEHTLNYSNISRGGKYISFQLELIVRDEAHRDSIARDLIDHPAIRMVL
jgi:uncharacterized protein